MPVAVINLFEVIGIYHKQRTDFLRLLLQMPADLLLCFLSVVKSCQGVSLRTAAEGINHILFLVNIRDDSYRLQRLSGIPILGRSTDPAPYVISVRILYTDFFRGIGRSLSHILHLLFQRFHILRMNVRELFSVSDPLIPGFIAEFFCPVGGKNQGIGTNIPFKNNICGLIHYDFMAFQGQTQFFSGIAGFRNIQHNTKELISARRFPDKTDTVRSPFITAVLTSDPAVDKSFILILRKGQHSFHNILLIRRMKHCRKAAAELFLQLLPPETGKLQKSLVNFRHYTVLILSAQKGAPGDIIKKILIFMAVSFSLIIHVYPSPCSNYIYYCCNEYSIAKAIGKGNGVFHCQYTETAVFQPYFRFSTLYSASSRSFTVSRIPFPLLSSVFSLVSLGLMPISA